MIDIDILKKAIEYSKTKSDYCDIRAITSSGETLTKSPSEEKVASSDTFGISVRVQRYGVYGYTSCQKTDLNTIKATIDRAEKLAKTLSTNTKTKISQKSYKSITDTKKTKVEEDPFEVPLEEKRKILNESFSYAKGKDIVFCQGRLAAGRTERQFVNTEDSTISTTITKTMISFTAVAKDDRKQTMNYDVYAKPAGFETIRTLDREKFVTGITKKAVSFLDSKKPPSGRMDVIMSPQVAGTLIHEVFGHASEADWIANKRSLLKDKLNQKIGTELMTIYDDGSLDSGWGTIYYDDEGIPAEKTLLLDKGILVQYMHSRETAQKLNMPLTGNGRMQDHTHRIIPRMTNTYLAAGTHSIDEMIRSVKKGIYVDKFTVALEDPAGGSFELKTLGGHLIENGELKNPIERATLSSSSFIDTFMNVEAVSKDINWMSTGSCGKGHEDWVSVGNPAPHVLVRNLIVGGN